MPMMTLRYLGPKNGSTASLGNSLLVGESYFWQKYSLLHQVQWIVVGHDEVG